MFVLALSSIMAFAIVAFLVEIAKLGEG
jgi:hypothetical protein